jgi:hypothetical protein
MGRVKLDPDLNFLGEARVSNLFRKIFSRPLWVRPEKRAREDKKPQKVIGVGSDSWR